MMYVNDHGIEHLDAARREQLSRSARPSPATRRVRLALAHTLAGWAAALAPEVRDTAPLRTRAAPN